MADWHSNVIVDSDLITGQQPVSAAEFGKVLLAMLNSQVRHRPTRQHLMELYGRFATELGYTAHEPLAALPQALAQVCTIEWAS